MIAPCGTFNYVAVVPEDWQVNQSPWQLAVSGQLVPCGDPICDDRLVGYSPTLQITDAGMTPEPSASRPAVLRSQLTLRASGKDHATVRAASIYVDRDLISAAIGGDELHISRTGCGGVGISLLRSGCLIFAVGAVSAVPLGNVKAGTPWELVREAEAVFRREQADFSFAEYPVRVRIGNDVRILSARSRAEIAGYRVWVECGYRLCLPGIDEKVAITLRGSCGEIPASCSVQLLNQTQFEMVSW